jgi:deoxyribodipyrimidine photo-lyase
MDPSVQHMASCRMDVDYPLPIVDDKAAMAFAKDRMYGLRKTPQARMEAADVQEKHGSRKSGLPPSGQRRKSKAPRALATSPAQGDLFA